MESITINLDLFERQFLVMLSENGGRVKMDHRNLKEGPIKALEGLKKKGVVFQKPSFDLFIYEYVLSSSGANIVDMIKKGKE